MTVRRQWATGALATALLLAAGAPSRADPCAPVVQALQRLGEAAQYRWSMQATTPKRRRPMEREQIVIGDMVYLTPDNGRWMRQRMGPAERSSRMADELARSPPQACQAEPGETRDNAAMLVYAYRQGDAAKRIWIGAADAMPHYFTSNENQVSVQMRVDYAGIAAPID